MMKKLIAHTFTKHQNQLTSHFNYIGMDRINYRETLQQQLPSFYPAFSQSSIRWLIFNEKSNGFYNCVIRLGRKVLIDLDAFENWVEHHKTVQGGVR